MITFLIIATHKISVLVKGHYWFENYDACMVKEKNKQSIW